MPDAPGKEAGLDATVAWVAETYPDIDLDSPPTSPPPSAPTSSMIPAVERLKVMVDPLLARLTAASNSVRRWIGSPPRASQPAREATDSCAEAASGSPARRDPCSTVPTIA